MVGVPFRLLREVSLEGSAEKVDKVLFLCTRRVGPEGEAFKKAKRDYRARLMDAARASQRHATLDAQITARERDPECDAATLAKMIDERESWLGRISEASEAAVEAAEKVAGLSLRPNYGDLTGQILNQLTDKDLHAMITVVETGEMPKDFFPSTEPPAKLTTTSPSGGSPAGSSSNGDSPAPTSSPAK